MRNNLKIISLLMFPLFFTGNVFAEDSGTSGSSPNYPVVGTDQNIEWTIHLRQQQLAIIKLENKIEEAKLKSSKVKDDGAFDLSTLNAIPTRKASQSIFGANPVKSSSKRNGRLNPTELKNMKIDSYMNKMNLKLKSTQIINGVTFAFVDYNGMIMKLKENEEVDFGYKVSGITENYFKVTSKTGSVRVVGFLPTVSNSGSAEVSSNGVRKSSSTSDLSSAPMFDENGVPVEPLHLK